MGQLLGIEESQIPEEEFDPRVRGIIAHKILERFHRHFVPATLDQLAARHEEARDVLAATAEEEFLAREWQSINAPDGLKRVEKIRIVSMVDRYLAIQFERMANARKKERGDWAPTLFEARFGMEAGDQTTAPFVLETPAGPISFRGMIDRIDVSGEDIRLVDYKTGRTPGPKDVVRGFNFQLNVYALAAETLILPGSTCTSAIYISLGREPYRDVLALNGADGNPLAAQLPSVVGGHVSALRAGRFHPSPFERCYSCRRHGACRYEKPRMAVKFPGLTRDDDETD
jgi:ATP-dependent helicase/DNAse subunit B